MSTDMIPGSPRFEEMVHVQEGIEFWVMPDLQVLLVFRMEELSVGHRKSL